MTFVTCNSWERAIAGGRGGERKGPRGHGNIAERREEEDEEREYRYLATQNSLPTLSNMFPDNWTDGLNSLMFWLLTFAFHYVCTNNYREQ